ncbi:NADH:flavin oxidoreductase [Deltaproteobacteria bacterium TL4]
MFTSFSLLGLQFKNRILSSPMIGNQANIDGRVNPELVRYYTSLARQGLGTVIIESAYVAKQGRRHICQLGISDEEHLEGLEKLAKSVKKEGSVIGIRLSHAGAKTSEDICGEQPVGPSMINFGKDYDMSREFDEGDIEEIQLFYTHAAERAEEVGMDFIEIDGSNQCLLDQCVSLRYNNRDDKYGTSDMESRLRLTNEIIQNIRGRISKKIPISYYFSIHDKLEDGFTVEELQELIDLLEKNGVDLFHPITIHVMNKFFETEETFIEWVAKYTKKPLIAEGNIKSPQVLKEVFSLNKAELYGLDRTLFSRPQWYQFLRKKMFTL